MRERDIEHIRAKYPWIGQKPIIFKVMLDSKTLLRLTAIAEKKNTTVPAILRETAYKLAK